MVNFTKIFRKPVVKIKKIHMCQLCKVEQAYRTGKYCLECKEEATRISRKNRDRNK